MRFPLEIVVQKTLYAIVFDRVWRQVHWSLDAVVDTI